MSQQHSTVFSPILKQKHKVNLQQLRLKSITVDARKTFVLKQPHLKKQIIKNEKQNNDFELLINGKGQNQLKQLHSGRRRFNYSEYQASTIMFSSCAFSFRQKPSIVGIESMFTIKKYNLSTRPLQ